MSLKRFGMAQPSLLRPILVAAGCAIARGHDGYDRQHPLAIADVWFVASQAHGAKCGHPISITEAPNELLTER